MNNRIALLATTALGLALVAAPFQFNPQDLTFGTAIAHAGGGGDGGPGGGGGGADATSASGSDVSAAASLGASIAEILGLTPANSQATDAVTQSE